MIFAKDKKQMVKKISELVKLLRNNLQFNVILSQDNQHSNMTKNSLLNLSVKHEI